MIAASAVLATIEVLDGTRAREAGEGAAARAAAASSGALAAVERTVASAGAGLLAEAGQAEPGRQAAASPLGCRLMAGAQVLTVAPVLVHGGADRFASDSVIAMAGAGATMATPVAVAGDGPAVLKGTRMLRLAAAPGVRPGDRLLVYGQAAGGAPGTLCAITRVARLLRAEPAAGDDGSAAADAALGGERIALAEPLSVSVRDAAVVHLGAAPQFVRLLVDDAQRLVVEDLLEPSAPRRVLAQAVRGLRVQVGIDEDRDGAVDLWLNARDDRADRAMAAGRVGALRVGLLGMPFERTAVARAARGPDEAGCADDGSVTVLDPVAGLPEPAVPPVPAAAPLAVSPEPSSGDGRQPTAMALATATATATAAATAATATAATAATATAIATATATAAAADCSLAGVASTVIPLRNATVGQP
ncbi:MAG: hypothetical protein QM674_02175 [Burkholderiaceae bacterium]